MKIRTDFVTNSSSSSFVMEIRIGLKNGQSLEFSGIGTTGEGDGDYYGITAHKDPGELGRSESIEALIQGLKDSVIEEDFWDEENDCECRRPVFDEKSGIIQGLRKLHSMDEIESIEISGERENECRDIGMYERESAIYHLDSGMIDYIYSGQDYMDEGCGGEIGFFPMYIHYSRPADMVLSITIRTEDGTEHSINAHAKENTGTITDMDEDELTDIFIGFESGEDLLKWLTSVYGKEVTHAAEFNEDATLLRSIQSMDEISVSEARHYDAERTKAFFNFYSYGSGSGSGSFERIVTCAAEKRTTEDTGTVRKH
ncbi:MAG: hypothetical protein IKE30_01995 [Clostridia bacterium]|nr:hypothetical protein [Clostridia bacterium]